MRGFYHPIPWLLIQCFLFLVTFDYVCYYEQTCNARNMHDRIFWLLWPQIYCPLITALWWYRFIGLISFIPGPFWSYDALENSQIMLKGEKHVCMKLSLSFFLSDCLTINAIFLQIKWMAFAARGFQKCHWKESVT